AVQHPAATRSATHAVFPPALLTSATPPVQRAAGVSPRDGDGSWRSWGRRSGVDRQEVRAESRQQAALEPALHGGQHAEQSRRNEIGHEGEVVQRRQLEPGNVLDLPRVEIRLKAFFDALQDREHVTQVEAKQRIDGVHLVDEYQAT